MNKANSSIAPTKKMNVRPTNLAIALQVIEPIADAVP